MTYVLRSILLKWEFYISTVTQGTERNKKYTSDIIK